MLNRHDVIGKQSNSVNQVKQRCWIWDHRHQQQQQSLLGLQYHRLMLSYGDDGYSMGTRRSTGERLVAAASTVSTPSLLRDGLTWSTSTPFGSEYWRTYKRRFMSPASLFSSCSACTCQSTNTHTGLTGSRLPKLLGFFQDFPEPQNHFSGPCHKLAMFK